MSPMGKRTALLAGLGALGVLTCAAVFWNEIAARIVLRRLRSDPSRVLQAAAEARSPVQRKAIRLFLQEEAGRKAFLSGLLQLFDLGRETNGSSQVPRLRDVDVGLAGFSEPPPAGERGVSGIWYYFRRPIIGRFGAIETTGQTYVDLRFLPTALEWLKELEGQEATLERLPGVRCFVMPYAAAWDEIHRTGALNPISSLPRTDFQKHPCAILMKRESKSLDGR